MEVLNGTFDCCIVNVESGHVCVSDEAVCVLSVESGYVCVSDGTVAIAMDEGTLDTRCVQEQ